MSAVGMPVDKEVFAECVRESREAADQKLAELDALITLRSPLAQGAYIWCELPVNNTDNTKNAQAPIFPAESGCSLQDPPDTKSQLLRRRRTRQGTILEVRRRHGENTIEK